MAMRILTLPLRFFGLDFLRPLFKNRRRKPHPLHSLLRFDLLEDRLAPATVSAVSLAAPLSDTAAGNVQSAASVSGNGRWVVYTDSAANVIPGQVMDTKTASDVFLYDRSTGVTTLVSHQAGSSSANLATTAHGTSKNPAISADGKWIAFVSNSDN